jgi:hypothetical protein
MLSLSSAMSPPAKSMDRPSNICQQVSFGVVVDVVGLFQGERWSDGDVSCLAS